MIISLMCVAIHTACAYQKCCNLNFIIGTSDNYIYCLFQVTMRLVWALHNIPSLKEAVAQGRAMFGTVDTWLLYQMTGGRLHVSDVSCASATGFYDPFAMEWADWAIRLFKIPNNMFPEVCDTCGDFFGSTLPDLWGASIPIRSSVNSWLFLIHNTYDVCSLHPPNNQW